MPMNMDKLAAAFALVPPSIVKEDEIMLVSPRAAALVPRSLLSSGRVRIDTAVPPPHAAFIIKGIGAKCRTE